MSQWRSLLRRATVTFADGTALAWATPQPVATGLPLAQDAAVNDAAADEYRRQLGDALTGASGSGLRPVGRNDG